jgi:hypothetical protein
MPGGLRMRKQNKIEIGLIFIAVLAIAFCSGGKEKPAQAGGGSYEDLVGLFKEWRDFQKPKVINGVPDYSAAAMKTQHQDLRKYQQRLAAIDSTSWPVSQQIDYHLVQAEMNGLDFDHRVLRPWSRNPSF